MTISTGKSAILFVIVTVAICAAPGVPRARAQAAAPAPSFEVVSIKPHAPGNDGMSSSSTATRFTVIGTTTRLLVTDAFDIHDFQLIGGPPWLNTDRYDLEAKMEDGAPTLLSEEGQKQISPRLQSMFIDRFKLKYHRTTQEFPVYELVVQKNGPKLQEAKPDEPYGEMVSAGQMVAHAFTMSDLAHQLSADLNRIVLDKTGVSGKYDITLRYAEDEDRPPAAYGAGAAPPDPGPSIFSALQEQLGLKLVSHKAPVGMVVIDHIEPPSPN